AGEEVREERRDEQEMDKPRLGQVVTSFRSLEADILESLSSRPVELGRTFVIPPLGGEVAASDPGRSAMAARPQLAKARLGREEGRIGLVEPVLLEQRAPEHELRAAHLVDIVDSAFEQLERMTRLSLRVRERAGPQMDLSERRDGPACVRLAPQIERDRERLLEQLNRLVGVAEQEVEPAEVVRELADVDTVGELGVGLACTLGVVPCEHPVAFAVGDERSLEVRSPDRAQILDTTGQLQRALDVVARSLEVALALPAARAPRENVRLERVARKAGPLGEPERLVEEGEGGLGAVELIAAAPEPEEHVGPLHVREGLGLADRTRLVEQDDGATVVADAHLRQPAPDQRPNLKLRHAGRARGRGQRIEGLRGLLVLLRLVQRLRPAQGSLEPRALVCGDAAREEAGIHTEALGEPIDRLRGRARLATLDLGDILLRAAIARELSLRQAGGDAQLAEPFTEANSLGVGSASG